MGSTARHRIIAEHMVQELARDDVIAALDKLLGAPLRYSAAAPAQSGGPSERPAARTSGGSRWWTALRSAELNALVESALQNNRSPAIAQARVRKSHALADAVAATASPPTDQTARAPRRGDTGQAAEGTEARHTATQATIAAEVVGAYLEAIGVVRQADALDAHLEQLQRSALVTERLFDAGAAHRFDVNRVETALLTAHTQSADLAGQLEMREQQLAALAGLSPHQLRLTYFGAEIPQPLPVDALLRHRETPR
jgi:outer membrane protein TolC